MEEKIPLLSELVDMYKRGEIAPEDPDSATFSAYLTEYHREHDILMHTHYYFLRRLADLPPTILIRRKENTINPLGDSNPANEALK